MKRSLLFLLLFLCLALIGCAAASFMVIPLPLLISGTTVSYRFFRMLTYFFHYLPAVICTGYMVTLSVVLPGRAAGEDVPRFSPLLMAMYKQVVCVAGIVVIVLTAVTQIFNPLVEAKKTYLEQLPGLFDEYMVLAHRSVVTKDYNAAYNYASRASVLDPSSAEAKNVLRTAELLREDHTEPAGNPAEERTEGALPSSADKRRGLMAGPDRVLDARELISMSIAAMEADEWFNAHYYAQLAVETAADRHTEAELAEAKTLAAEAWTRIAEIEALADGETQRFFAAKKSGYAAIMSGDNLRAYYIFNRLSAMSAVYAGDPDVMRYYKIAKDRLASEVFFTDETSRLEVFEHLTDLYFTLRGQDGSCTVVYIRGITDRRNKGSLVRYLRGLHVFDYDADGRFVRSMSVSYAKMLVISVPEQNLQVPYILLKSVDRNTEGIVSEPLYRFADETVGKTADRPMTLTLPMPVEDIALIADAASGPGAMNINTLMKFVDKAPSYGYSAEIYGLALENHLLYPFRLFILLIFFASIAWNYRLLEHRVFKFYWIFFIPLFAGFMYFVLRCIDYLFTLVNFICVGLMGQQHALLLSVAVYIVGLFAVSLLFLSRKSD